MKKVWLFLTDKDSPFRRNQFWFLALACSFLPFFQVSCLNSYKNYSGFDLVVKGYFDSGLWVLIWCHAELTVLAVFSVACVVALSIFPSMLLKLYRLFFMVIALVSLATFSALNHELFYKSIVSPNNLKTIWLLYGFYIFLFATTIGVIETWYTWPKLGYEPSKLLGQVDDLKLVRFRRNLFKLAYLSPSLLLTIYLFSYIPSSIVKCNT
jgi:hypothetical protein